MKKGKTYIRKGYLKKVPGKRKQVLVKAQRVKYPKK